MKKGLILLILLISNSIVFSQTSIENNQNDLELNDDLLDSVKVMYKGYIKFLSSEDSITEIKNSIQRLEINYTRFNDLLESNNQALSKLTNNQLFTQQKQLEQRRKKIINTADFVYTANVSLNAIKQLDATSDYLNKVTKLNSPQNNDLGFSLSEEITNILERTVIKGENKINGVKTNKFLSFVNNIINLPISTTISSAVPVVGAIKSVIDLVVNTAIQGKDVTVNDIVELKTSLNIYVQHYSGLAKAQLEFEQNLSNLEIRKNALIALLNQYTVERINTLSPNSVDAADYSSLTSLINDHYKTDKIQGKVDIIMEEKEDNPLELLTEERLIYPNYALNQAKFIRDEIEALGKEYVSIYQSYQTSLTEILINSKEIGDEEKIDKEINELDKSLNIVLVNFDESLNIPALNSEFQTLAEY